ncbi:MAG: MBL fold metallo-hydrolase RNA specificity domain-containing protein [candidate division KSB1 bacterium]|nr:MBL fold metallo-hydrolase RNA specificity domain-containing protein [candidate division KSB1 bacterium]
MFFYDPKGIKLHRHELWLDAHRKTTYSFVSHGHADHLKNHDKILATPVTAAFHALRARQKQVIELEFGEKYDLGDICIELYPAGHVLGSAMIRIEVQGVSLLYTGDFKVKPSLTARQIEIPKADLLIMESTFGSPEYVYDHPQGHLEQELYGFIEDCFKIGVTPIVMGYSLGKAQEAMKILENGGYRIRVHRAAWEIAKIYRRYGVTFERCTPWKDEPVEPNEVLLIPPHLLRFRKVQNLPPRNRKVLLSGWAGRDGGPHFRCDHAIPLSDHADFQELLDFVRQVDPQHVFTTHGAKSFPHYLRDIGFKAEYLTDTSEFTIL